MKGPCEALVEAIYRDEIEPLKERNARMVAALELAKDCIRSGSSDDFPLTRLENETIAAINEALAK